MARVLVVDDSPLVRVILCDLLRDLGHEPIPAGTADEALVLCARYDPDLVIKDLVMEDADPILFMEELRAINAELPIVVCSTIGRRQEICQALRAGANDFLVKPIDRAEVARVVERYALHH
ncbi:MAG: response regulator [Firmicutes bacterium]|nr:response regulator [Bacillota bacterium]